MTGTAAMKAPHCSISTSPGPGDRRRCARLLLGLTAAFLGACQVASYPAEHGGRRLEGSADVWMDAPTPFFLSPDGRWIVYVSRRGEPKGNRLALIDTEERHAAREIRDDRELLTGRLPPVALEPGALRWTPDSGRVSLRVGGAGYSACLDCPAPSWEEVGSDGGTWVSGEPAATSSSIEVSASGGSLEIRPRHAGFAGSIVHRFRLVSDLRVASYSFSSDGGAVAYVVTGRGVVFPFIPRGYVAESVGGSIGPARLIGSPLYGPVVWHPTERRLFACAHGSGEEEGIYSWEF